MYSAVIYIYNIYVYISYSYLSPWRLKNCKTKHSWWHTYANPLVVYLMCWWDISLLPMLLCWCAYICSIIETMTPWRFPLNIMFGPEVGTYVISLCRENSLCKFLYLYLKRIFTFIIYLQMAKRGNSTFWEIKTIFFGL